MAADRAVHGVLVQLPLPPHIAEEPVLEARPRTVRKLNIFSDAFCSPGSRCCHDGPRACIRQSTPAVLCGA